jgi:hypothetical protein
MSHVTVKKQIESIINAVSSFSHGASIEDLRAILAGSVADRTLQRRLSMLVQQGFLIRDGQGRASRYRLDVKAKINQPTSERIPVGYRRAFLDSYHPNSSFYLPAATRQHLMDVGRAEIGVRPAGTYAKTILHRLLIDLSWNSSRLEGNTYSLLETERLLDQGELAAGKNAQDAQMILNHKSAIKFLVECVEDIGFSRHTILNLHALLSNNLLSDPAACGRLRRIPVGIAKTVYYPLEIPAQIEECFQQIIDTAAAIQDPFEQAFFAMVQLPYLQPFEDVNKRVSRLAANIPFIRDNLCPLSFIDVSEQHYIDGMLAVYELNRIDLLHDVFVFAYERSVLRYAAVRESLGEPDLFRMRYHRLIVDVISMIVSGGMNKLASVEFIQQRTLQDVPFEDRTHFIDVINTELRSLHDGNIARYGLRLAAYQSWRRLWEA